VNERMNPAVKAQWLEALRSGEYEQGYEVLRTADGCFCTWGVLCDLAMKNGVPLAIETYPMDSCVTYGGEAYRAPQAVKEWAGIKRVPELGRDEYLTISYLNDERRMSFPEIADLIEEHL
jgi:hypothetical protein